MNSLSAERGGSGNAPADSGWLLPGLPLHVEVSPWYNGAQPGDWRDQIIALRRRIEEGGNRISQTSNSSAVGPADKSAFDVAQIVLLGAAALRELRLAFTAWLERDRARRINLTVSDGTRTGTLTIEGGPLSDEALRVAIRSALNTTGQDREASGDADG